MGVRFAELKLRVEAEIIPNDSDAVVPKEVNSLPRHAEEC